jgi:tetratricopeptide (TPR) repeat protein
MKTGTLFLAIPLLWALGGPAAAQHGMIRGKVRAPSGATLTNVIVELWGSGGNLGQTVTTNDGDFAFSGLNPEIYEIVIRHPGYQPVSEKAHFRFERNDARREVVTLDITLKPLAPATPATPPGVSFAQEVPPAAREAFDKGLARLKEDKSAEGIALLKQAIQLFPDYFNAHFALGTELSKQNQPEAALQALERARQINDRDARVYHLFGILMARQGKFMVAEYAFREAIGRDPTNPQSYFSRALALLELALKEPNQLRRDLKLAEAERDFNKALNLSGQKLAASYLHLARIHEQRGDRQAAARALETYLKLQPDDKHAPAIREAMGKLKEKP